LFRRPPDIPHLFRIRYHMHSQEQRQCHDNRPR
jgi:hypothetical protein